ncbi:MAG: ABC transporter permease [candidate division Zixibacteria bacterium]|nr:ABC transporter permease [candidate division Zixibacteria bacterium]
MNKLWVMICKELREGIATRSFIIGTILTPVIMVAVFMIPAWLSNRTKDTTYRIGLMEVGSNQLEGFARFISGDTITSGKPQWSIAYRSISPADSSILMRDWTDSTLANKLDAYCVADTSVGDSGALLLYSANLSRMNMIRELRARFTDYIIAGRTAAEGLDATLARSLTRRVELETHKLGSKGRSKSEFMSDYVGALIFVMVLFTMIFGYGAQLMRALFEEKSARIIEVLVSSVTPFQIMMSKIVGQGMVAMAQVALWVIMGLVVAASGIALSGRVVGGLAILGSWSFVFWFTVNLLLGYLLYSCWFAIVGSVASSDQEAQPFLGPVVMLLMLPVALMFALINQPNSILMRFLSLVPPFSPVAMVMRMNLSTVPLWENVLSALLLASAVAAAGWVAGRIFRVGVLMTGKRPTLPEVLKWIHHR